MSYPVFLEHAAGTARRRLAAIAASAADLCPSHAMWLAMLKAEIDLSSFRGDVSSQVEPVLDNLIFLAHDSLVIDATDAANRAVRILDLRLEATQELAAHTFFVSPNPSDLIVSAAAVRTAAEWPFLDEVSARSVVGIDPLVLGHAFRDSPRHNAVAGAILAANPGITMAELLAATRATALPRTGTATPSWP